jgi:ATP-dependent Clp protease ATP-binding subunit ClpA
MSNFNPVFSNVVEVEDFIAQNFEICPSPVFSSIDFLIVLNQMHPSAFDEALFNLHINDEDFSNFLENAHQAILTTHDAENPATDFDFTDEFRDFTDALENAMDVEDHSFDYTQLLSFFIQYQNTVAGVVLSFAKEGHLWELDFAKAHELIVGNEEAAQQQAQYYAEKTQETSMGNQFPAKRENTSEAVVEEPQTGLSALTDLTAQAKDVHFDPVIGRDSEIDVAVQVLLRKEKRNPIFIGEAGVGKTAAVYGLVKRIADGEVPEDLKGKQVLSLDIASLIAGTSHRGEFEEKLKNVLEHVKKTEAILFIDEIHTMVGAGSSSGSLDMANILKPYMSDAINPICVMGATTFQGFKKLEKDSALERRMGKVTVSEPSPELAVDMIKGKRDAYVAHHGGLELTDAAIELAVEQTHRHIHDLHLPDKAFSVIDSALAAQRAGIVPPSGKAGVVDTADIYAQISKDLGREVGALDNPEIKQKLLSLSDRFNAVVINQESAIEQVSKRVRNSGTNLFASARKNKTLGSFMFVGPTGVGKTELTKQLAEELNIPLIRYDMSEFSEQASVKRLIGADPSFVGYEDGGQLVNDIRKNPSCVLLLDEIEKAHSSVYKVLLQIMDDAKLKDGQGRVANFQNCYVVMTSNIGASVEEIRGIGFAAETKTVETQRLDLIKQVFSPEFVGRLDEAVDFNDLTEMKDFMKIIDVHLAPQIEDLKAHDINVEFNDNAKEYIVNKCLKEKLGARPIKKALETYFQTPISEAFCAEAFNAGDTITVSAPKNDNDGESLDFAYTKPKQLRLGAPKQEKALQMN